MIRALKLSWLPRQSMVWVSTVGLVSSLVFALSRSFSLWGGGGWVGRMP